MTDREFRDELLRRLDRESAPQSHPRRVSGWEKVMYIVLIVMCLGVLWNVVIAPVLFAPAASQPTPQPLTAYPSAPLSQPASVPQAQPQIIYVEREPAATALPQATTGAVIVVTPTFDGCHDGQSYINGVATNGGCTGGAYAPEAATATPEMVAATAVPLDPTYRQTLEDQQPHKIR